MNDIKKLRTQYGITQVELAKILRVSSRSIQRWENNNESPNRLTMLHIEALVDLRRNPLPD